MDETFDAPPPKRTRLPLGVLLPAAALLLGAGAGFGGARFLGDAKAETPAEVEAPEVATAEAAAPAGSHGAAPNLTPAVAPTAPTIVNLGTFTVNLRGSGGGRVLRLEVQLESPIGSKDAVAAKVPQLRDSVITAVSDYTWSEVEGTDGKTRLRDELLARINGVTAPALVERLYFTQFVVQ